MVPMKVKSYLYLAVVRRLHTCFIMPYSVSPAASDEKLSCLYILVRCYPCSSEETFISLFLLQLRSTGNTSRQSNQTSVIAEPCQVSPMSTSSAESIELDADRQQTETKDVCTKPSPTTTGRSTDYAKPTAKFPRIIYESQVLNSTDVQDVSGMANSDNTLDQLAYNYYEKVDVEPETRYNRLSGEYIQESTLKYTGSVSFH
jgi:hypothetical protein